MANQHASSTTDDTTDDTGTPRTRPSAPESERREESPRPSFLSKWKLMFAVALLVLAADQVTKFQAVKHLTFAFDRANAVTLSEQVSAYFSENGLRHLATPPKHVFRSWWSHLYAENPGAAWSFAASWPDHVRIPFFHVASLLAIVLIAFYFHTLAAGQRLLRVALSLVMGGALGNLMDRLVRGYVIDFIDWHLNDPAWMNPRLHWPTFNVADVAITVGVLLIALDSVLAWVAEKRAA